MQHMYMHEHNVELKEEEEDEGKKWRKNGEKV